MKSECRHTARIGRSLLQASLHPDGNLTLTEASDVIGISDHDLILFMDTGALAFTLEGANNEFRIKTSDLLDFVDRRNRAKKFVASILANGAEIDASIINEIAPITDEALKELDAL